MGLSPEQREQIDGTAARDRPIEVLRRNVVVVQAYLACQWESETLVAGDRLVTLYKGVAATEIEAVLSVLNVPPRKRRRVTSGIRIMARVAQEILNDGC